MHGSLGKSARSLKSRITAAISETEGQHIYQKGRTSTTFVLGGASHRLCEPIKICTDVKTLFKDGFEFEYNEANKIVGMVEKTTVDIAQTLPGIENLSRNDDKKRSIKFEYPLEPPKNGQTKTEWVLDIFQNSFKEILNEFGSLPEKPFDIEQVFKDSNTLYVLMQSLEVAHYAFGIDHGLSLVDWEDSNGTIKLENIKEFQALDWMAVIRNVLEANNENENIGKDEGALIEISEGDIMVLSDGTNGDRVTEKIKGNKIDIMRLKWRDGTNDKPDNWGSEIPLRKAIQLINGSRFNSQETKYRRKGMVMGRVQDVVTLNSRNVRNLFKELYNIYGEKIFTSLEITIDDLKFPAGDGGWFQQYNPEYLPEKKHVDQVAGYLFKVMTQLFWVKKWSEKQANFLDGLASPDDFEKIHSIENFPVDVDEISTFIADYQLYDRITGRLLYQLPSGEIRKNVVWETDVDEIIKGGKRIFDVATKREKQKRLHLLQTLARFLKPQIKTLEVVERKPKSLPEEMKDICVECDGGIFLCIDKLSTLLKEGAESGDLDIENMVLFPDKNISVIWINNLLPEIHRTRISVDKNGNYSVSYDFEGGRTHFSGKLLSSIKMRGVSERDTNLATLYKQEIWDLARKNSLSSEVVSTNDLIVKVEGSDFIIYPDGSLRRRIVGKPIVCLWNPMESDRWYLDVKLLEETIESNASHKDTWGLNGLIELVNKKYTGNVQIMCPMPAHENTNTEAAHWYGKGESGPHIKCFAECADGTIDLTPSLGMKHSISFEPVATGKTVHDFRPVTIERQKAFETTLKFAAITERHSNIATRYLVEERGLSPEDIGEYGYVPMGLAKALSKIVESEGFWDLKKRSPRITLDLMANALKTYNIPDSTGEMESAIDEAMHLLGFINDQDEKEKLMSILTATTLMEMRRRGIIETRSKENREKNSRIKARLGGRIILPTYFVNPSKHGRDAFVRVNFMARGIVLDGQPLFEDNPQHKAWIRQGKYSRDGQILLSVPAGFWARDWDSLITNVSSRKEIIIFEGPINVGSFGRIRPDYKDVGISNIGYNHKALFAFLRFLGIVGDEDSPGQGLGVGIEDIYFANDWDKTGAVKFHDRKEELEAIFPKLRVHPIHDLLPDDILAIVPPYDLDLVNISDKKDQNLRGKKLDMNDLINAKAEEDLLLKPIRDRYAYKP